MLLSANGLWLAVAGPDRLHTWIRAELHENCGSNRSRPDALSCTPEVRVRHGQGENQTVKRYAGMFSEAIRDTGKPEIVITAIIWQKTGGLWAEWEGDEITGDCWSSETLCIGANVCSSAILQTHFMDGRFFFSFLAKTHCFNELNFNIYTWGAKKRKKKLF